MHLLSHYLNIAQIKDCLFQLMNYVFPNIKGKVHINMNLTLIRTKQVMIVFDVRKKDCIHTSYNKECRNTFIPTFFIF